MSIEKDSRRIFHELHKVQASDPYILKRLKDLLNTEHLGVDKDFFKGKVCADIGCGSTAYATYKMLEMGAEKVYALDLDSSIKETMLEILKPFEGRYEIVIGSALNLPFKDNQFDFVHCSGVLHHTADFWKGFEEVARITKRYLYVELYGKGGLMREFNNLLREKYQTDAGFKVIVDNLTHEKVWQWVNWILDSMKANGDDFADKIDRELLNNLFDNDKVLTIKDRITSPIYRECSWDETVEFLTKHGFTEIKRLTKYPRFRNIRKFLAPMYYEYDNEFSRLFYGGGTVEFIASKSLSQ